MSSRSQVVVAFLLASLIANVVLAQSQDRELVRQMRAPSPKFIRFGRAGQKFIRFGRSSPDTWDEDALEEIAALDDAIIDKRAGAKFIRFG